MKMTAETDGYECYHCKQWVRQDEAHDCWTTTEAALTRDLSEDLSDAWERLRETAADFGEQRIYASHHSIMFSRKSCYFFVRPKRKFLEVCIFLDRPIHDPRVRRVERPSRKKVANVVRITHRDEVEPPFTDWLREAYDLFDRRQEGPGIASPPVTRRSNLAKKASATRKSAARKTSGRKTTSRKTTSRKTTSRKTTARKSSAKRSAVKNRAGSFYAKRKSTGRFKEMDEKGRSLKTDRRKKAKRSTKAGYGDQGDRRSSSKKR